MGDNDLFFKSATELGRELRARRISSVELTQSFLDRLGNLGPRYNALAALKLASVALDQAEIRSPLAGTVAWIGPKVGEFVAPGAPVLRVGDLSLWRIETTDLTELNIVNVKAGNAVKITFDASSR